MNPKKGTNTHAALTGRHILRDLNLIEPRPDTNAVGAKDCEILRLHIFHLIFICDTPRTACSIRLVVSVEGGCWELWAWVVALLNVAAWRRGVVGGGAFVARDFESS